VGTTGISWGGVSVTDNLDGTGEYDLGTAFDVNGEISITVLNTIAEGPVNATVEKENTLETGASGNITWQPGALANFLFETQPAANQLRSVGTQSFTGSGAITEHGLFSVITESAGVLWDRSVFSAINVDNGDSIEWTYTCTVSAGG